MSALGPPSPPGGETASALLAVNARTPYEVLAYSFREGYADSPTDIGPPKLITLALIRSEDEAWIRDNEHEQRELFCLLEPAEPESQIAGFTFEAKVSGFRDLRERGFAAEFTSVGPITPHFMRG